jgi:hypothetical protein
MQQDIGIRGKITIKGGSSTEYPRKKLLFRDISELGPPRPERFEFPPEKGYIEGAVPGRGKPLGTWRKP